MKGSLGRNFFNIHLSQRLNKKGGIGKLELSFIILGQLVNITIRASSRRLKFLRSKIWKIKSKKDQAMRRRIFWNKLILTFLNLTSKITLTCLKNLMKVLGSLTRLGKDTRKCLQTLLVLQPSVQTQNFSKDWSTSSKWLQPISRRTRKSTWSKQLLKCSPTW